MKVDRLVLLLGLSFLGCNGEQPTDTSGDADTDTDADTDADVDNDEIANATAVDFDGDAAQILVEDDLDDAGDRDFFKLDLVAGDTIAVHAMGLTADGGLPDTVVRVYGPDEVMIGENDDLPFRINNTDAGYIFRAEAEGTHYVEVLEWSDWAGKAAEGGNGWDYNLYVNRGIGDDEFNLPYDELTEGLNETVADELLNLESLYDTDDTNNVYTWFSDPWSDNLIAGGAEINGNYFGVGDIGKAGDVDTLGLHYEWTDKDDAFVPGVVSFSMFTDLVTDLDAEFELYNADGELLASTDQVDVTIDFVGGNWDQGIAIPVFEVSDYFLQVKDSAGAGSRNHWYAIFAYTQAYTEVVTFHDVSSGAEVDYKDSTDAIMNDSTVTKDAYWAWSFGNFEDGADEFDSFRFTNGVYPGNFVYVDCATAVNGSMLRAHVDLVDQAGTVIATGDTQPDQVDDPRILEAEIPTGVTELYAVIKRDTDNTASGNGASYQCYFVSDTTDDSADF